MFRRVCTARILTVVDVLDDCDSPWGSPIHGLYADTKDVCEQRAGYSLHAPNHGERYLTSTQATITNLGLIGTTQRHCPGGRRRGLDDLNVNQNGR